MDGQFFCVNIKKQRRNRIYGKLAFDKPVLRNQVFIVNGILRVDKNRRYCRDTKHANSNQKGEFDDVRKTVYPEFYHSPNGNDYPESA